MLVRRHFDPHNKLQKDIVESQKLGVNFALKPRTAVLSSMYIRLQLA